jgi:hypothetical protein
MMIGDGHWMFGLAVLLISLGLADRATGDETTEVVTYGARVAVSGAPEYDVSVNGRQVFVYNSRKAAFATFSFSGSAVMKITPLVAVESVDIRPLSFGVQHEQQGNTIQFTLTEPRHLSIEINGKSGRPPFCSPILSRPKCRRGMPPECITTGVAVFIMSGWLR